MLLNINIIIIPKNALFRCDSKAAFFIVHIWAHEMKNLIIYISAWCQSLYVWLTVRFSPFHFNQLFDVASLC